MEGEASSDRSATSLPFPASKRKQRDPCRAQCHWEVEAGRIRKGQDQGSQLQGNKGKPNPPGIILTLETEESTDSGSMGFSGEEREGGGVQSRMLHQGKCATLCPNYPQSCEGSYYLFRCFIFECSLACFGCMPAPRLPMIWLWSWCYRLH